MTAGWFSWIFGGGRRAARAPKPSDAPADLAADKKRRHDLHNEAAAVSAQLEYQKMRALHYARYGTDLDDDLAAGRDGRRPGVHGADA